MAAAELQAQVRAALAGPLAEHGVDLEDVAITRAGRREVVRVIVDRNGGVDLDAIAGLSHVVSAVLDGPAFASALTNAYVLEVTSPGVDRPLTELRHWQRNVDRLVEVRLVDGQVVAGRITAVDDAGATVTTDAKTGRTTVVRFGDVARAQVQIEFNRAGSAADDTDDNDADDTIELDEAIDTEGGQD